MNDVMMSRTNLKGGKLLGAALIVLSCVAAGAAAAQGVAQGPPNAMQGFSQNRDQPIQIEAASLEMIDKKKEATFSGDVKVVQGDTTMKSKTLVVFYDSAGQGTPAAASPQAPAKGAQKAPIKAAQPGPGGSSSIKRLEARGNVIVTQKDQVVTGETAVFDTRTNLVTMIGGPGGVVLTQGKNVLRGERLVVDMTTGTSRVEGGRVQMLLESAGAKPGGAPTSLVPVPSSNKPR